MTNSSTRGPKLSARQVSQALSFTARTLTQRCTAPGQTPWPSTGAGSRLLNIIGTASGEPSVTKVCTGQSSCAASAE